MHQNLWQVLQEMAHLFCTDVSFSCRWPRCCSRPWSRVSVGCSSCPETHSSHRACSQAGQNRWATCGPQASGGHIPMDESHHTHVKPDPKVEQPPRVHR